MMLILMAGGTSERRAFEQQSAMAFLTGHDGVAPDERKSGDVVIEGRYAAPAGLPVTLLTTAAELALVRVILAVTRHAGRRQLVAIEIARVAGIALDLRVRGFQRKLRRLVVIEADRAPFALVVAAIALAAVSSGVDILNLVAIRARGADALVAFVNMARRARDGTMRPFQPELRSVVVERLDAMPCRLAMTIFARFPQTPFVRIVRLVTVEAASGRVAELYGLGVTAAARHCLVCVPEREIRKFVIERLAVEPDDVGTSPLVIRMTMGAFRFCCVRFTPVISPAFLTVCGNLLVARKAEPRLRPL
jgi:hypothetical protein